MKKQTLKRDMRAILEEKIYNQGGWVNTHAHLDRAYTITRKTLPLANAKLQDKWFLVDKMKRSSTIGQIYDRMAHATEQLLKQGVQAIGTFIDVDQVIEDKAIKAAQKLRDKYRRALELKFINQTLKGVIDPEARKWFEEGAAFVDILGGLPGKDKGKEAEHLDILFTTAKKQKKLVHVHVDQLNTQKEKETELLAKKTLEYGLEGKVVAIHSISLAAHPKRYRQKVYRLLKKAQVGVISCPTAWIDSRRSEETAPIHNSVTPVDELVPAGITVALGTDNITDVYKPFTDGDMWTELRFLLESCHYYDLNALVKISTENGLRVLGLK